MLPWLWASDPVIEERTGGGFTGAGIAEEAVGLTGGKGKKHRMLLNGLAAAFCFCASAWWMLGWIFVQSNKRGKDEQYFMQPQRLLSGLDFVYTVCRS